MPDPAVGALTLHTPSLMRPDPQLWFALAELEFQNNRITGNLSLFRWIAGSIPLDVTLQVKNAIVSLLSCEALKKAVIIMTAHDKDERIRSLV